MVSVKIPVIEDSVDFPVPSSGKPCKTWYTIYGALKPGIRPLICLHGGPGIPHDYLLPISNLASSRAVIFYDQLGCGKSTHLPSKNGDTSFWTVELFLDELNNLLEHLGIQDDYDMLGQSWGGMLGAELAIRHPKGLNRLVIADSPASIDLWLQSANRLRDALPQEVQKILQEHERDGTTESEEYKQAMMVFYRRHTCRLDPWPEVLIRSFASTEEDPTVYRTMYGPSEFYVVGNLKTWSVIDQVHKIQVPTLLINGAYDEATDEAVDPYFKSIPKVQWAKFENSSHLPHLEEPDEFLKVVKTFLA